MTWSGFRVYLESRFNLGVMTHWGVTFNCLYLDVVWFGICTLFFSPYNKWDTTYRETTENFQRKNHCIIQPTSNFVNVNCYGSLFCFAQKVRLFRWLFRMGESDYLNDNLWYRGHSQRKEKYIYFLFSILFEERFFRTIEVQGFVLNKLTLVYSLLPRCHLACRNARCTPKHGEISGG